MERPEQRRLLVVSAGMGEGHDAVAGELARRLTDMGCRVRRQDLLTLLPWGVGDTLRRSYRLTVRRCPRLYGLVYAAFFRPRGDGPQEPGSAPIASLAETRLLQAVRTWRPDTVVTTFHLAAQVVGRLRFRGDLPVPGAVVVTDLAVHRQWMHRGNDLHLCITDTAAADAASGTGRPAVATGPVVAPAFAPGTALRTAARWTQLLERYAAGRTPVLLSLGAWGVGSGPDRTASLLADSGYLPVVLCGRDERLRRRMARVPGTLALDWVRDLAGLMAAAGALVDNAAGQTALQALSVGLPVVGYRPIAGHGVEGVASMAAAGLSAHARSPGELLRVLAPLARPGPAREAAVARGHAIFRADAARALADLAGGARDTGSRMAGT